MSDDKRNVKNDQKDNTIMLKTKTTIRSLDHNIQFNEDTVDDPSKWQDLHTVAFAQGEEYKSIAFA